MDIGIVFPYMDTYGGAQIFALECIKYWKKKHDITMYSVIFDNTLYDNYDIDFDIKPINIPIKSKLMNFPLLLQNRIASKYIDEHEIYNSHMFPCHALNIENNIWVPHEPSRILYDLKVLMKNEGFLKNTLYNVSTPILRYIDQNSYKVSKTVANSYYSKEYLEKVYNIKINDVVYPGVDYEKYASQKDVEKKDTILLVSRLYKEKNVEIGIQALSLLEDSFNMKIVGTGPYKPELIKIVNELKLNNQVEFMDFVDDEKLIELYNEALCVIFMPYKEPFGMVALESMAAGTPVIGLENGGGYSEIIQNNINSFTINQTPTQIAQKIKQLKEDEKFYKKMSKNCKKTAKEHTWKNTSKQMLNIFENYMTNKI